MTRSTDWMFATFCLLGASEWLMAPLPLQVRALVFAVLGGVAAALQVGRRRKLNGRVSARLSLAAVLLLGVPEVLEHWAVQHVAGAMSTAMLALVPVILALILAQQNSLALRFLYPALVGLAGILLLIPLSLAGSFVGRIAIAVLLVAALCVSLASVWVHHLMQEFTLLQSVAVVSLSNAIVLGLVGHFFGVTGWSVHGAWGSVLVTGVEGVLLVALLRSVAPLRLGSRFLLIPLLTIMEGVVLLRPTITSRMVVGLLLLAGGALFLLLSRDAADEPSLSLL